MVITLLRLPLVAALLLVFPALAQPVSLPYVFNDASGSTWDVQFDGSIGDGGNDLYDGGGRLFLNNATQYLSPTQQATLDVARNELTFPSMAVEGVNVSRRVAVLPALSTLRFTEVLENPTAGAKKIQLRTYFNMGQAVQQILPLLDGKKTHQPCGYAIADPVNAVAMVAAARGAKFRPRFSARQNDDNVDVFYDVDVPAHQTVAIVHFQVRARTADQALEAWRALKEKDLLKDLPKDLRKRVLNFPGGDPFVGDFELLRGDALDVVELRGGDSYRGTLKLDRYRLHALYGQVTIPASRVVGLINVGAFRPAQLVVTADGEVFAGRLDTDTIQLQLTGGQITTIPLALVTRIGYRRRAGEPEEWNFDNKSVAFLRSGERLLVQRPTTDYNLATPSGPIRLNPAVIASIVFEGDENSVPEVRLTDGTHLSALLGASSFDMTLAGGAQRARLPAAAMLKFKFAPDTEADDLAPALTLTNADALVGTIGGTLSLQTPFDTIHVEGNQVKAMTHARPGGDHDVQITLWDDSTLSGRLAESHLTCQLNCGVTLRVPVALLENYRQPLPVPSPAMISKIRAIVRRLDADDWRTRDAAQAQLVAIGPPVMSVLRQLQPSAPTEAARRIDLILDRLSRELDTKSSPPAPDASDLPPIPMLR
jgi:hypothetical protein